MRPPGRSVFALRFPQRRNNPTYESISGTMSQFLAWRRSLSGWLLSGIACLTLAGCSAGFSPHTAEGTAAPGQAPASGGRFCRGRLRGYLGAQQRCQRQKSPLLAAGALTVPIASRRRRRGRRRNAIPTTAGRTRSVAASCLLMLKLPLRSAATWWRGLDTFSPQIAVSGPPAVSALARRPDPSAAAGGRACPLR